MYIYRVAFLALFIHCTVSQAQNTFEAYEQKVEKISDLEDIHEKKYQLTEFAKDFKGFLSNSAVEDDIADRKFIHFTKSSDSKYKIYYYNTFDKGMLYRLDWFIVYGGMNEKNVLHFFESEISQTDHRGSGSFDLHLAKQEHGDVSMYPLTFTFRADKKIYKQYHDVSLICMFEDLMRRYSKQEILNLNDTILKHMNILWHEKEYMKDSFEGLKRVSTLISEDQKVKVCTWNVLLPSSENMFFGAVVLEDPTGKIVVHQLNDDSDRMRSPEKAVLTARKWYGAVYYEMVPVKDKTYGTYYVLLGYKPNNEMTKKKVIDPLIVTNGVFIKFGHSVFQTERVVDKRLIFEYSASANMMLKYDKDNERFVLDHLAPSNSMFKDNYRMYGPDFSYDSYVLEKGKWVLVKDVDLRNPSNGH